MLTAVLDAYARSLGQLGDPRLRRPLVLSVLGSLALFVALEAALIGGFVGGVSTGSWIADWAIAAVGGVGIAVLGCFLFPAVALLILGLFLDAAVRAVEARWYPGLPPPRRQPIGEMVASAVRVGLLALAVALATLLLGLLLPGVNLILFYVLNGYVLAREYFELVAFRRLDPAAARSVWLRHRLLFVLAGVPIAFLLTVPFANLLAPLLGAAATVHLFERVRGASAGDRLDRAGRRDRIATLS